MEASATRGSTQTPSSATPRGPAGWPSPTSRATSRPSRPGLSSCSTERSTRGWAQDDKEGKKTICWQHLSRSRWSPTCWMTSSVTSVREGGVAASLPPSSVLTWLVSRYKVLSRIKLLTHHDNVSVLLWAVLVLYSQSPGERVPQAPGQGGGGQAQGRPLQVVLGHQYIMGSGGQPWLAGQYSR